jgi:hypothetical protein
MPLDLSFTLHLSKGIKEVVIMVGSRKWGFLV